ncbi:MAG: VWA domain-containing protein [Candidatus Omnitrophica bacterium]|nr:VWA domain-containing protein [Candidatus Omnitrophota bacterium]
MKFGDITFYYWFLGVFILIMFYVHAFNVKKKIIRGFVGENIENKLLPDIDYRRRKIKITFIIMALSLCVLALMRPQWGFKWEQVRKKGLDILIAVDVSNSMLAEDIKPNRFERTKLAIQDMVRKLTGDRIGLIAFSGSSFLQCPLTIDYSGFMLTLKDLEVGSIPIGGTSISSAIIEAINTFDAQEQKNKILIVITDGEDHEGDAIRAAERAKKENIKIYCIGIGSTEGEIIPYLDSNGKRGFLKDREGNVVKTRLDETLLQKIALMTGGSYVRSASTDFGLDIIYNEKLSKLEKRDIESKMKRNYTERFQFPLMAAFIILLIEPLIGDKKRHWFGDRI